MYRNATGGVPYFYNFSVTIIFMLILLARFLASLGGFVRNLFLIFFLFFEIFHNYVTYVRT